MNKKGFTLVELLAVIVLVSLLMGLGVVGVSRISKNMKEKAFKEKISLIEQAAVLYGQDNKALLQSSGTCPTDEGVFSCKSITIRELIENDYLESENINELEYKNPKDNTSMLDNKVFIYKKNNRVYANFSLSVNVFLEEKNSGNYVEHIKKQVKKYFDNRGSAEGVTINDLIANNYIVDIDDSYDFKLKKDDSIKIYETDSKDDIYDKIIIPLITTTKKTTKKTTSTTTKVTTATKPIDINSEYAEHILVLYDELKKVANNYIANNTITSEVYFEFADGVMNVVDKYGNRLKQVSMNNINGSGELRINTKKQFSVTIYQEDKDIKNNYGDLKLYDEPLKYSRDMVELVKNLGRLELLTQDLYGRGTSDEYSALHKKTWAVPYYIRQMKYTSTAYDLITGYGPSVVTTIDNKATYLKEYFKDKQEFTVNGDTVDFKHMMAVLAGLIYNTPGPHHEHEYNSLVSWAGDYHTFLTEDILINSNFNVDFNTLNVDTITSGHPAVRVFGDETYKLLGKSGTSFDLADMYADVDAWIIYYNLNKDITISEAFDAYYSGSHVKNYKIRFTQFKRILMSVASSMFSGQSFADDEAKLKKIVHYFTNLNEEWLEIDSTLTTNITGYSYKTEKEKKYWDSVRSSIYYNFVTWINDQAKTEPRKN